MSVSQHVAGAVIGITLGIMAVLPAADRRVPLEVEERTLLTEVVPPGGEVLLRVTVDRERNTCDTSVYPTIYDGIGYEWKLPEDRRPAFGPAGPDTRLAHYPVPPGAAEGAAKLRIVVTFRCNYMHYVLPVTLVLPDVPFEIGTPPEAVTERAFDGWVLSELGH